VTTADGVRCPDCGSEELVRAQKQAGLLFRLWPQARCLDCGRRFSVSKDAWERLRVPELGEPWENWSDRHEYMLHTRMSKCQIVTTLLSLGIGIWASIVLEFRFNQPVLGAVFLPIVFGGWWLGHWLSPRRAVIPGKCRHCRYDLRGLTSDRCPECGTPIRNARTG